MTKIAIVGSGLIGRAWATVFASHGFDVALQDVAPGAAEAARTHIATNLRELAEHGLVDDPKGSLARIRVASGLADALAGADFVQENGPETVEAKRALFAEMDALATPEAILSSSTSFIMASVFSEGLKGRARCLVGHPVNPPHLVPIVEIAPAPWTDPAVVERAKAIYEKAGQVPITLRKEKAGFVLNRLQAVLLAEAFRLVGEGVASAEDVDKTIRDGLGLRWAFMGPFETIELNAPGGIPDYCSRYAASLDRMVKSSEGQANPFEATTVAEVMREWRGAQSPDRVKRLSDWRDGRLAALRAHKRTAARKPD
ncbi:3-hydroxyacyl-CoA dehydrogenase [Bosea sp. (in: a-proteobacteria)]|uniref:3-hydroxyacyl-CoA dehydrogenase n=1 Tax=Bosea sp. (in: a-proteobacteria) TaxID=1871050 RepID=UPI001AD2DF84|nr:3-hydroxyacyl-CoA dehydrogenase [Bosea sp. (in: a-proteobacteria)]MBN9445056.1 3-hydroxyacyl-CoA dehydrogenase [Bosea sp. (in: a-proteobacteria)]